MISCQDEQPRFTEIAKREGVTDRYVSCLIDLAHLAPTLVERCLNGHQPAGASAKRLSLDIDLHPLWRMQCEQLSHPACSIQ
jgi:hypothetical protein